MSEKFKVLLKDGKELNAKGSFENLSKQRLNKDYPFFHFDDLMIRKDSVAVIEKVEEERNEAVEYLLGLENRIVELEHQAKMTKLNNEINKQELNINLKIDKLSNENAEGAATTIINTLKRWGDKIDPSIEEKYKDSIGLMVKDGGFTSENLISFFKVLDVRMEELSIDGVSGIYRKYKILNENVPQIEFLEKLSGKLYLGNLITLMKCIEKIDLEFMNEIRNGINKNK